MKPNIETVTEDAEAWLVSWYFVRKEARGAGDSQALLGAAVELTGDHSPAAIEGITYTGDKRRSG